MRRNVHSYDVLLSVEVWKNIDLQRHQFQVVVVW